METKNVNVIRNQKGFTLIEIIAVLVILGILAAVAVPKYADLQNQATQKALDGALAAAYSTCSLQYSKLILTNGSAPALAALVTEVSANPPSGSGFTYAFAASGTTGIACTVTDTASNTKTGTWTMP